MKPEWLFGSFPQWLVFVIYTYLYKNCLHLESRVDMVNPSFQCYGHVAEVKARPAAPSDACRGREHAVHAHSTTCRFWAALVSAATATFVGHKNVFFLCFSAWCGNRSCIFAIIGKSRSWGMLLRAGPCPSMVNIVKSSVGQLVVAFSMPWFGENRSPSDQRSSNTVI